MQEILKSLSEVFSENQIIEPSNDKFEYYLNSTTPTPQKPFCIVKPNTESEVQKLVGIASQHNLSLYPISTGQNWGYADSSAVTGGQIVVDFSNMNKVLKFDDTLGLVTIQPGVRQQDLYDFLEKNNSNFMVPITGAGPSCSLVGNALERGFGLNAIQDHFSAVHALRGILADGSIYESAFNAISPQSIPVFKWHTGPYLDGIFAQANTLIVTEMTLALEVRPKAKTVFLAEFQSEENFFEGFDAVRTIFQKHGKSIGAIQMSDKLRLISMMEPYPSYLNEGETISRKEIEKISKKHNVSDWTLSFVLSGETNVTKSIAKDCKSILKPYAKVKVVSEKVIKIVHDLLNKISKISNLVFVEKLSAVLALLDLSEGKPHEIGLALPYWRGGKKVPQENINPSQDNCGLVWFAPVVPFKGGDMKKAVKIIREICYKYGFEPTISATGLTSRCVECTIPILYNKEKESEKVQECYKELFENCREEGYLPYRYPNFFMEELTHAGDSYWNTVQKVKEALDPNFTISPGRYSKLPKA